MKQMKNIGITMMAALALAATSCSDFDDYNEVGTSTLPTADATLWENISTQENLSDFKALLVKTGYDKLLQASNYYTVWAPQNGSYDAAKWQAADSATARKQFVENHVSQYNYGASGDFSSRVLAANEKKYTFTSQGGLTFAGIEVAKANVPASNGMLHLLKQAVPFYPNLYEYMQENQKTDSLSKFIAKYESRVLDEANSVKGPIENGLQTYLDSVMVIENSMLGWSGLNAKLDNEDSTYTVLLPTNEAWDKSYAHLKNYFNFNVKQIVGEDLASSGEAVVNPGDIKKTTTEIEDHAYLTDSLTHQYMVKHLVYSNNSTYNKCLEKASFAETDSLMSTYGGFFSHPGDILAHKVAEMKMSNGRGWVVDSIAFRADEWFNPVWASRAIARNKGAVASRVSARSINPKYGSYPDGIDFAMIKSSNENGVNSWMEFTLPPLLSTKYRFYAVVVPADADMDCDSYAPADVDSVKVGDVMVSTAKPAYFYATLSYCNAKGEIAYHYFTSAKDNKSVSADDATALAGMDIALNSGKEKITAAQKTKFGFISDSTKIDTICLGDFTFPISYMNQIFVPQRDNQLTYIDASSMAVPNLKLRIPYLPTNKVAMKKYTPNWRIANILMVPVELIEQRNEN